MTLVGPSLDTLRKEFLGKNFRLVPSYEAEEKAAPTRRPPSPSAPSRPSRICTALATFIVTSSPRTSPVLLLSLQEEIAVGRDNRRLLYMLDFGIAKNYRDEKNLTKQVKKKRREISGCRASSSSSWAR